MIDDVLGKLVADKYRVESLVRESEAGDLFTGRHEVMGKPVTIKVLSKALAIDARWVKRFIDEARTASAVTDTNILNITDFGTDAKGITYAVFEPTKGRTLRDILPNGSELDEKRALGIARQIASAVSAGYSKKVIHGDLTPGNVFIDEDESGGEIVKVFGFGSDPMEVARDADPRYLAPEQCNAFPAADERSDIYSLGVIVYEMLSGVVPYDGATAAELLAKQNAEPPPPLSAFRRDLHPEVEPIVLSAIASDPERRYPTMKAFAEDLDLLAGGAAAPAKAAAAVGDTSKRNIWQTAFVVLAGVAILAVALIYATSVRKTDPTTQLQADAGSLPVQPIGPATGAQEESLAKLPAMTDAEIMASSTTGLPQDTLPGGDGYNAWGNGGVPPAGAPLNQNVPPGNYVPVPPGGATVTIVPNGTSQFVPPAGCENGVWDPSRNGWLCDSGSFANPVKPPTISKTPPGNTVVQPSPTPNATPKPMAIPPKVDKPPAGQPGKDKSPPANKPAKSGKPADSN